MICKPGRRLSRNGGAQFRLRPIGRVATTLSVGQWTFPTPSRTADSVVITVRRARRAAETNARCGNHRLLAGGADRRGIVVATPSPRTLSLQTNHPPPYPYPCASPVSQLSQSSYRNYNVVTGPVTGAAVARRYHEHGRTVPSKPLVAIRGVAVRP